MSSDSKEEELLKAVERCALNKSFVESLNYKIFNTMSYVEKKELFDKMLAIKDKDDMLFEFFASLNKEQINYLLSTIDPQDCQYSRSSWRCRKMLQDANVKFQTN